MRQRKIKTIQHVKFNTSNVWLAMCLSNLLLEQFFILEEDWLPLLEIRLLLKRSEAATVTHVFKKRHPKFSVKASVILTYTYPAQGVQCVR